MITKTQLRNLYQSPSERSLEKQMNVLEEHGKRLIANSPLVVISTHSEEGNCDCSPRGGPAGFVKILTMLNAHIGKTVLPESHEEIAKRYEQTMIAKE